eukprot:TRINITY_DN4641_c1_g1_i1.p1 TRINITY_DN4641_c1_g1~~TRINITY_DN4641_c1_g1_i1.p1  ORF type:complete len:634 (-),score=224.89 TRINITY_DN4641_c1_g1_i1:94-1995(-)
MTPQKRIDPEDGQAYTYEELAAFYQGKYKKKVIEAYWEDECKPAGKKGKAKAEPKAKGKAKPEPKAKAKAKAKAKESKPRERGPANPKKFMNDEKLAVQECLDGLVWTTPNLARLDTYPDIKVVFRTDWDKSKVAIISGGGAGHEPLHAGFIGKGMLTAAVSGETFASPTIDAVLSAIVQVTGAAGCLLVIKNYTGDRLNFTLAAQRARSMFGLKVETVITKDDVATVAERGVAGTLFVHKVCGAMAEAGSSLDAVKKAAEDVIEASASMGVAFSSVRRLKPEMIAAKKMEVGLGIHGEAGARTVAKEGADKCVEVIMEGIMEGARIKGKEAPLGYAFLLNNLGGVPPQEMCIVANSLRKSKWADSLKLLIGPAPMCTSLDMNGISISLLRLTADFEKHLCAATEAPAWPAAYKPAYPALVAGIKSLDVMEGVTASSDSDVMAALKKICNTLIAAKKELDDLDAKVGDADCGSTMAAAGNTVLEEAEKLPLADPQKTCACLSALLGKTMGGSSGVLMSIMFMGMSSSFEKSSAKGWKEHGGKAFMDGLEAMMQAGGASKGSRTMLDALVPAAEAFVEGKGFAGAKEAAVKGAEATKTMAPRAGRSENVPEKVWKNVPDPGAIAAAKVFAALAS